MKEIHDIANVYDSYCDLRFMRMNTVNSRIIVRNSFRKNILVTRTLMISRSINQNIVVTKCIIGSVHNLRPGCGDFLGQNETFVIER